MNTISLRESFHEVVLMLPDSLDKVRGYADIQSAVRFVRKYVDAGGPHV